MLHLQDIRIGTKKGRLFAVHLERWGETIFECKLAAINLGPALPADATFGPFSGGSTAGEAFSNLISKLKASLAKLDPEDEIETIDNPCNAEFHSAEQQRQVVGESVSIKVNGKDA